MTQYTCRYINNDGSKTDFVFPLICPYGPAQWKVGDKIMFNSHGSTRAFDPDPDCLRFYMYRVIIEQVEENYQPRDEDDDFYH
ncbi:MAG: hypothetical protein WCO55_01325 [Candidatus Falkowbacteria bacterium]